MIEHFQKSALPTLFQFCMGWVSLSAIYALVNIIKQQHVTGPAEHMRTCGLVLTKFWAKIIKMSYLYKKILCLIKSKKKIWCTIKRYSVHVQVGFEHNLCKILGCRQKIWSWLNRAREGGGGGQSCLVCTMLN